MNEPVWLTGHQIAMVHGEQLAIFGGPPGLRDAGLLASALDRARNKFGYGERKTAALAAAYAFGLAKNHPFVDGNKRTAFAAMMIFLRRNGVAFAPPAAEATAAILALAAGELSEEALAAWIADRMPK